jgi:hypothetical protein
MNFWVKQSFFYNFLYENALVILIIDENYVMKVDERMF